MHSNRVQPIENTQHKKTFQNTYNTIIVTLIFSNGEIFEWVHIVKVTVLLLFTAMCQVKIVFPYKHIKAMREQKNKKQKAEQIQNTNKDMKMRFK